MKAEHSLPVTTNKAVVLTATAFLLNSNNKPMPTTQLKPQTYPESQSVFRGTRTNSRANRQEGKRGSYPCQSVVERSETEIGSLVLRAQPVFRGTRTNSRANRQEGKRGSYPCQSVVERSETEIGSLVLRAQPVFRGTRKEGKRGSYDV
ncbi:hypothetical protein C8D91_0665 [Marinicella litoralis]|uniref:Uncharacterized protein n=1 Tax=Marinicella litoralis TaxID=644220 RepID=A0A4R6XYS9_9GAMM|nr:hypothetical protein C8D91_0665 [Marinicella litoralis]